MFCSIRGSLYRRIDGAYNMAASEITINSIVGTGTEVCGVFNIAGPLRIDGKFEGKINSTGKVYIGKHGRAEATIVANNIVVGGYVKGDIYAEKNVVVLKSAEIDGNIYTCSVNMDNGVLFNGECRILGEGEMKDLLLSKRKEKYVMQ